MPGLWAYLELWRMVAEAVRTEASSAAADKPQTPAASKPRGRRGNGNSNQGSPVRRVVLL